MRPSKKAVLVRTWTLLVMANALAVGALVAQTPEQRYFEWTDLPFPADEYVTRRARLAAELRQADSAIFLTPSGSGVSHGETFRPLNDFLYFTGLELPNAILGIYPDGNATVFVDRRDPRFESPTRKNDFPGRPLADDRSLAGRTGLLIRPFDELGTYLTDLATGTSLLVNVGRRGEVPMIELSPIHDWSPEEGLVAWLQRDYSHTIANAYEAVARVRMVKSAPEIAVMRQAAEITANGIKHAARFIRDGVSERALEGELEASFKRQGAQRRAFSSIIKSGPNSLWPWRILAAHYDRRNRVMRGGDLVIFDVGAEYDFYVSDVGRTFPVSGTFTPRQRAILEMEVAVSQAIIDAVRPGVTFAELQTVAERAIPEEHSPYMQTGLFFGHHLGLDTGDPSLAEIPLHPGMIFTVEPWYYNHDEGISVFTEDEILVTTTGAEVLTRHLPRSPEALEALMTNARR